jgi:hypothetical protein
MSTENTLRYLKTDFQSHKDALLQRVRARWPRLWNDFLTNSFGVVLVELVAWSTSTLAYLINRLAGEKYTSTMTLRESAVRLGGNFGYQLHGPVPASISCEAVLTTAQAADVTIAKGTLLRTADDAAIPFEVSQDYTILAGNLSPITPIVSIAAGLSGANTLATRVSVVQGSSNADLTDSSIDLTQFAGAGQTFQAVGDSASYVIFGIESAPGAVSSNRLVLASAWTGATGIVDGAISDRRIVLAQGQTITDRFVSPSAESPGFSVKLSRTPVIDNSVSVSVNNEPWVPVSSLVSESFDSTSFTVKTFSTGETTVSFGDNKFGAQIPTEAIIEISYRVGGGVEGNIKVNSISTSVTGIIKSTSSPVTITLSNISSSGVGGRDAETLEEARVNIPYFVRSNNRAVTLDDYQTVAQQFSHPQFGSVAYARAAVRTENALLEGNLVVIYAWTTGTGGGLVSLTPQLKLALQTYMQTKACGTDLVQIFDGSARPLPISVRFKTFGGFSVVDTKRALLDTLNATITALRPGQPVLFSNLVRALDSVAGVDTLNIATPIADLSTSSTTELFTIPQDAYVYTLARNGVGVPVTSSVDGGSISLYEAQLPVFPVEAWSFRLFLGVSELTVAPGLKPGFAQLYGDNLSTNSTKDSNKNLTYGSTVNLLTGKIQLWLKGAPGDLTMKLVPMQGYSSDRSINVYVGYSGDNSQTKRREIRAALRSWADGLPVGGTMYAKEISGVTVSKSNVSDAVASVVGVDTVNRVALDTPANTSDRINPVDFELLKLGNLIINNQVD